MRGFLDALFLDWDFTVLVLVPVFGHSLGTDNECKRRKPRWIVRDSHSTRPGISDIEQLFVDVFVEFSVFVTLMFVLNGLKNGFCDRELFTAPGSEGKLLSFELIRDCEHFLLIV